jgi:hypothetical protein
MSPAGSTAILSAMPEEQAGLLAQLQGARRHTVAARRLHSPYRLPTFRERSHQPLSPGHHQLTDAKPARQLSRSKKSKPTMNSSLRGNDGKTAQQHAMFVLDA